MFCAGVPSWPCVVPGRFGRSRAPRPCQTRHLHRAIQKLAQRSLSPGAVPPVMQRRAPKGMTNLFCQGGVALKRPSAPSMRPISRPLRPVSAAGATQNLSAPCRLVCHRTESITTRHSPTWPTPTRMRRIWSISRPISTPCPPAMRSTKSTNWPCPSGCVAGWVCGSGSTRTMAGSWSLSKTLN